MDSLTPARGPRISLLFAFSVLPRPCTHTTTSISLFQWVDRLPFAQFYFLSLLSFHRDKPAIRRCGLLGLFIRLRDALQSVCFGFSNRCVAFLTRRGVQLGVRSPSVNALDVVHCWTLKCWHCSRNDSTSSDLITRFD